MLWLEGSESPLLPFSYFSGTGAVSMMRGDATTVDGKSIWTMHLMRKMGHLVKHEEKEERRDLFLQSYFRAIGSMPEPGPLRACRQGLPDSKGARTSGETYCMGSKLLNGHSN